MENFPELNAQETQEQFRTKCLAEAGLNYSIAAVLPLILSLAVSFIALLIVGEDYSSADWYLYFAYLVSQLCFAGAAVIYFARSKEPVKNAFKGCKWYYFLLAILLQFGLFFSLSALNEYFIAFFEMLGYEESLSPIPSLSGWNLIPALIVIALLPAICEETIFRGILSRNMHARGWGLLSTCLIAGAMFSLFHGNPEQTAYQFVCGACFTLVAIRSGSIFPTMVAHFLNNAIILIFTSRGISDFSAIPQVWNIVLYTLSALCFVGTLVYLVIFDKNGNQKGGVKAGKLFFLAAAVGIAVCGAEWIVALVTGFIHG